MKLVPHRVDFRSTVCSRSLARRVSLGIALFALLAVRASAAVHPVPAVLVAMRSA